MGSVIIRTIAEADKEAWKRLWEGYNAFYERTVAAEVTEKTFSRFFDKNEPVWAAVAENPNKEVIGFATWLTHRSTASIEDVIYLNDLFVDPNTRNGGVGRSLIEHVYDDAKKQGIKKVYWHTQHFNHRAQLLYTKVAKKTDFVQYAHTVE